jgi:hypothetical protein
MVDVSGGAAVGRDPDRVTDRAELRKSLECKSMHRLPFGAYLARPSVAGDIVFLCKSGKEVERGYVTGLRHPSK